MNKEELIKELIELKNERMDDLKKINAQHDILAEIVANLNYLITEATRGDSDD